jgi:hypothetical protein
MGTAATQIVGERIFDISFGRLLVLCQQVGGLHHHSVDAVTALCGLLIDKSLLQRVQFCPLGEPLKGDDFLFELDCDKGRNTGANSNAVDMDRAGAALAQSTAKAGAAQSEIVTKCIEYRHLRVVVFHRHRFAIDVERFRSCHLCLPTATSVDAGIVATARCWRLLALSGTTKVLGVHEKSTAKTKPAPKP